MKSLLIEAENCTLIGFDNNNDYYDVSLKEHHLDQLSQIKTNNANKFIRGDLADKPLLESMFAEYHFDIVMNSDA